MTREVRTDVHHVLFPRVEWTARPQSRALRTAQFLTPRIDREVHNELHLVCPPVPLLGYHALLKVLSEFTPHGNAMQTMDELLKAIEMSNKHTRQDPIHRELGMLTMEALELQKPFLVDEVQR